MEINKASSTTLLATMKDTATTAVSTIITLVEQYYYASIPKK